MNRVQNIVKRILYNVRFVDPTILVALSILASKQSKATTQTIKNLHQLLDYLVTHPDAKIWYYASNMILIVPLDASYLSAKYARSRVSGHLFLWWTTQEKHPIHLNGENSTLCNILKCISDSTAVAELGAQFWNANESKMVILTLRELEHPQPPTPIYCKNATATGISDGTVKRQQSRSMEMRYFYIFDTVIHREVKLNLHPGQENLGNYT